MISDANRPAFSLGRVVATPAALDATSDAERNEFLHRHQCGDWGECPEDDKKANDAAVSSGDVRIVSAYQAAAGETVWLITEADRSLTTMLLPSDY